MKNVVFDSEAYENQLAICLLEALEKEGIISISSKDDLIKEIGEEETVWDKEIN